MTTETRTESERRTAWRIDPAHSSVEFGIKHMMFTTVKGRFAAFTGRVVMDEAESARSSVEVEIDAASVDTRDAQRDAHLRSPEFFDAETYPTLRFRSTRVERRADGGLEIAGDLTIRDVSRPAVLETTYNGRGTTPFGHEVAGFTAETRLNRKDYGLNWNAAVEAGGWLVGNEVRITLEIQAAREGQALSRRAERGQGGNQPGTAAHASGRGRRPPPTVLRIPTRPPRSYRSFPGINGSPVAAR